MPRCAVLRVAPFVLGDIPLRVHEVLTRVAGIHQMIEHALRAEQFVGSALLRGVAGAVPTDRVQQADKLGDLAWPSHARMQIAPLVRTSG